MKFTPWVAHIKRFAADAALPGCEWCGQQLAATHLHLVGPGRRLSCACQACAARLAGEGTCRRVPEHVALLPEFVLSDAQWAAFLLPIDMAFFFISSSDGRVVALYPGPAGATESLLELDAWRDLVAVNPVLECLEPDVEALLVNRVSGARQYYRVPIDRCYALVGLIRRHWHGLSGGAEAWRAIDGFFAGLQAGAHAHA
jgi:hypothetical protein